MELSIHHVPAFQMFVSLSSPAFSHELNKIDPQAVVLCEHLCFFRHSPTVCLVSVGGKGSTGCLHFHLALYFPRLGVLCH